MIDEKTRIKLVRVLLGLSSKGLAAKLGVAAQTVYAWECGRADPVRSTRARLSQLCVDARIAFLPSGMPVPMEDIMPVAEYANNETLSVPVEQPAGMVGYESRRARNG